MKLKKIMLLVAISLAAVAMIAPEAQADAPEWYHGEETIAGEEDLHLVGTLSTSISVFIAGGCEVTYEGTISNTEGMASGAITGGQIQHICPTSNPSCTITPTLQNFPWTLTGTTVTGEPGVEIVGAQFEIHYLGSCPLPVSTLMMTGTATGLVDENGCLSLEGHQDDIVSHAPLPTWLFDTRGILCDTTLTLT